jgi:hypothetical protein
MSEIDVLLSASLKRLAPDGDTAGVADAIRSRVDAGDTGTPASTSGFGAARPSVMSWLPWVGLVVVAGVVGGLLGRLGVLGTNVSEVTTARTATLADETTALVCIGGADATELPAGQRVLAVSRAEDSAWLGLRDPLNIAATVWVPAAAVQLDEGQDVAALPLGGTCPIVETTLVVPQAPVTPTPTPVANDTTAPSLSAGKWSPDPIYGASIAPYCDTETLLVVDASDNAAVTNVAAVADLAEAIVTLISVSGSQYTFALSADYDTGPDVVVNVLVTATDSSGNQTSLTRSVTLVSAGNCVI